MPAPDDPSAGFPLVDHDRAMEVRRAVLGDDHVDAAVAGTTAENAPFQDLATRVAWGGLWSRHGLSRRDRSLVTIGILAALGRTGEVRLHLRAALERTGVDRDEIVEALLHVGVYAGLPAANEAFALLGEVAAEVEGNGDPDGDSQMVDAAHSGHPGPANEASDAPGPGSDAP